jgi:hypothetical protein
MVYPVSTEVTLQRDRYYRNNIHQTLPLKCLLHLLHFSVKADSPDNSIIKIQTSAVSIQLLTPEELKSSMNADVGGEDINQDDVEQMLAAISKSCEEIKLLLEKAGTKSDRKDPQDERSISVTPTGSSERCDRAHAANDLTDEELELGVSSAKKKR